MRSTQRPRSMIATGLVHFLASASASATKMSPWKRHQVAFSDLWCTANDANPRGTPRWGQVGSLPFQTCHRCWRSKHSTAFLFLGHQIVGSWKCLKKQSTSRFLIFGKEAQAKNRTTGSLRQASESSWPFQQNLVSFVGNTPSIHWQLSVVDAPGKPGHKQEDSRLPAVYSQHQSKTSKQLKFSIFQRIQKQTRIPTLCKYWLTNPFWLLSPLVFCSCVAKGPHWTTCHHSSPVKVLGHFMVSFFFYLSVLFLLYRFLGAFTKIPWLFCNQTSTHPMELLLRPHSS